MEEIEKFAELVKTLNGVSDTKMLALALKASKFADNVDVNEKIVVNMDRPIHDITYVPIPYIQTVPISQPFDWRDYTITCCHKDNIAGCKE